MPVATMPSSAHSSPHEPALVESKHQSEIACPTIFFVHYQFGTKIPDMKLDPLQVMTTPSLTLKPNSK